MKLLTSSFVVLLSLVAISSCQPEQIDVISDDFEDNPSSIYLVVFGDIQYYTNPTNINLYHFSLDWIQKKKENGMHINCILHTGDITQNNDIAQYECFYQATRSIASQIPFVSLIGDHDYTWEGVYINDRLSSHFNDFIQFPLTTKKVVAWFEEGRMENIVVENTIFGQRMDFLVLEFGPREEVVAWADAYVKTHQDHLFILMNHEYLETGGGRRTKGLKCKARLRNTTYSTPDQLWDNLIRCNDNIRLVLCGHVGGLYAFTLDTNDFGREIPQIQHNIQGSEYRYDNWLMLWEFPQDCNSVNVFIYNTKTEQYYNNQKVLFTFKY